MKSSCGPILLSLFLATMLLFHSSTFAVTLAPDLPLFKAQTDSLPARLQEVVVTATRTEKRLEDVPFPVNIIGKREIARAGMIRLDEVLAEQTGLTLISEHGTGIQMQGFAPDYTLILLDGQPLVGRTTGTLELSRVAVGNIERIEIVKGPTSSLYGSEALAGVINIITQKPKDGTSAGFSAQYGGNETADLGVSFSQRKKKLGLYGFVNRYSSGGYRLAENIPGPTVPPFQAYTFQLKGDYRFNESTEAVFSGRYFDERQKSDYLLTEEGVERNVDESGIGRDFNLTASVKHRFSESTNASVRLYHTGYRTESDIVYREDRTLYDASYFDQRFLRPELQVNHQFGENMKLTGGTGWVNESVQATRYAGKKQFNSGYVFLQTEWVPLERLSLILGGRFDAHSEYSSQLSPRVSGQYRFAPGLSAYISFGRGYKAPDFRQLYLNFTNPVAGYSVFGSKEMEQRLAELDASGQIAAYLADPALFRTVAAESSLSYNAGLRYTPFPDIKINLNLFRNDVENLIESVPVARKTNGQSVFSYLNLNKIFTQGIEVNAVYYLRNNLEIGAGYQFLEAYDKDVLSRLDKGELFRRDPATGITERVARADYAGLSNRSKHMGNVKISYSGFRRGFNISLRGIFRGRYGFGDYNGNTIVDIPEEYVKGYTVLNLALSKQLLNNKLTLRLEVENLLDYTDAAHIPTLPGRLFYAGLNFNIGKRQ